LTAPDNIDISVEYFDSFKDDFSLEVLLFVTGFRLFKEWEFEDPVLSMKANTIVKLSHRALLLGGVHYQPFADNLPL
jgi:hypothetical protein